MADDSKFVTFIGLLVIVVVVLVAIAFYGTGYRYGQIDAANGLQSYASIETDAGTRWYRKDNPGKLFERRTPE